MSSLLELLKNKKQQIAAGSRKKTAKFIDGTSRWRILPSWRKDGSDQFWHDFGAHYIRKPGDDKPTVYVCADKTFGRPCQVCATIGAAIKSATDDATVELLTDAKSTGRVLVNAMHLDGPSPGEVQILEMPPSVFGQLVDIMTEWIEAGESPLNVGPGKGKDFLVTRTGTGKNTKYTVQIAAKTSNVPVDVLTKLNNLDEYVATENAEAEQRALATVRTAAGLLTAPTTAGGVSASKLTAPAAATTIVEEDDYAVAAPPPKKATTEYKPTGLTADQPITDVPDSVTAPAAVAEESSGDPELDALLKSLG